MKGGIFACRVFLTKSQRLHLEAVNKNRAVGGPTKKPNPEAANPKEVKAIPRLKWEFPKIGDPNIVP